MEIDGRMQALRPSERTSLEIVETPSVPDLGASLTWQQSFGIDFPASTPPNTPPQTLRDHLESMRKRSSEPPNEDNLVLWSNNSATSPDVIGVAQTILALPITQVSVERAFSHLPQVITNRRGNLLNSTVENILIRKLNYK